MENLCIVYRICIAGDFCDLDLKSFESVERITHRLLYVVVAVVVVVALSGTSSGEREQRRTTNVQLKQKQTNYY